MSVSLLQESILDGSDYNQFHTSLAQSLVEKKFPAAVFEPSPTGWNQLDFLGPVCRAFSLSKHLDSIINSTVLYSSPMSALPFMEEKTKHVIHVPYLAESLVRAINRPEYGEEALVLKKYLEETRLSGVNFDSSKDEYYRLIKESEEIVCQNEKYTFIVPNRVVKEDLNKYYNVAPHRVTVIPYGINNNWLNQNQPCSVCDRYFADLKLDTPTLIWYASLHHGLTDFLSQGVDRILETFQRIRELQKIVILDTNDPAYKPLFQKKAAIVIENPSPEHLPHLFHRAGIFVQTARYETRNLPIIQAMASSLPVVSFSVGMAEDYIETGKNGFLVQNLIQLIAKVDFLRNNSLKSKEIGHNSYIVAKNKFSIDKSRDHYEKYFNSIINL